MGLSIFFHVLFVKLPVYTICALSCWVGYLFLVDLIEKHIYNEPCSFCAVEVYKQMAALPPYPHLP